MDRFIVKTLAGRVAGSGLGLALALAITAAASPAAFAQSSLTLTVSGVRNAQGEVVVGLCSNPKDAFPGACPGGYQLAARAAKGDVVVRFANLKPGDYAVEVFHDENGNKIPDIPSEGFAYGNNQSWPPDFKKASVHVEGDARTATSMIYLDDSFVPTTAGQR